LVTVANHTATHVNLIPLSPDRLREEIETAHDQLTSRLSAAPRYLAIPFGHLRQHLALDCLDLIAPLHYDGILWVGQAATLITAPYRTQPLHLTRMHAPTTVDDFVHRTQTMAEHAVPTAIWTVPQRAHREPVTVIESSDPVAATRFEMLARQGKDYASDPGFYRYQFTDNPAKGNRPDYYAVQRDGRIEATAYNVHAFFRIGAATVPGVYLGSWRKLPNAHPSAAGTLVQRMTAREAVVGVYHPSSIAAPAFAHWHPIPICRLTLSADPTGDLARLQRALELDTFDDTVSPLADALMHATDFTLLRDRPFYRWRHESYPLADCRYIVLARRTDRLAYAVTLQRGDRVEIADWYAASPAGYAQLLTAVQDNARDHGARTIEVETSDRALADHLAARHEAEIRHGTNFYHFNRDRLADAGIGGTAVDDLLGRWPDLRFHETASTGDLLLR
jgi:peptidoglycan/xylan/chitin deacetylase (PgdA/CDA1 family)